MLGGHAQKPHRPAPLPGTLKQSHCGLVDLSLVVGRYIQRHLACKSRKVGVAEFDSDGSCVETGLYETLGHQLAEVLHLLLQRFRIGQIAAEGPFVAYRLDPVLSHHGV